MFSLCVFIRIAASISPPFPHLPVPPASFPYQARHVRGGHGKIRGHRHGIDESSVEAQAEGGEKQDVEVVAFMKPDEGGRRFDRGKASNVPKVSVAKSLIPLFWHISDILLVYVFFDPCVVLWSAYPFTGLNSRVECARTDLVAFRKGAGAARSARLSISTETFESIFCRGVGPEGGMI